MCKFMFISHMDNCMRTCVVFTFSRGVGREHPLSITTVASSDHYTSHYLPFWPCGVLDPERALRHVCKFAAGCRQAPMCERKFIAGKQIKPQCLGTSVECCVESSKWRMRSVLAGTIYSCSVRPYLYLPKIGARMCNHTSVCICFAMPCAAPQKAVPKTPCCDQLHEHSHDKCAVVCVGMALSHEKRQHQKNLSVFLPCDWTVDYWYYNPNVSTCCRNTATF